MLKVIRSGNIPTPVKHASLLLFCYALWVLVNALYFAIESSGAHTQELTRGLVRFATISGISLWLLSRHGLSWWFAVGISGLLTFSGIGAILTLIFNEELSSYIMGRAMFLLIPSLYFVGHALIILIKADVRNYFTRNAMP